MFVRSENFRPFLGRLQKIPVIYYTLLWLFIEFLLCLLFTHTEPTYSFDWDAYMEQVSVFRTGLSSKTYIIMNRTDPSSSSLSSAATILDGASPSIYHRPIVSSTAPVYQYDLLQGDTGPLAYPAGHLWIHNLLSLYYAWNATYYTTEYTPKLIDGYTLRTYRPVDILSSIQNMYTLLWLLTCIIISQVYTQIGLLNNQYPFHIVMVYTIASFTRRTRNIFILGFFNDSWNTFFLWLSVYSFIKLYALTIAYQYRHISTGTSSLSTAVSSSSSSVSHQYNLLFYQKFCAFTSPVSSSSLFWLWILASILYSFSVSIKMNSLLVAPGILFIYLDTWRIRSFDTRHTDTKNNHHHHSTITGNVRNYIQNLSSIQLLFTVIQLTVCALVQIIVARPFLYANGWIYFTSAFNFSRTFAIEWSINWYWLSETIFHHSFFSRSLLLVHLGTLFYLSNYWIRLLYQDYFSTAVPSFFMFNSSNLISLKNVPENTVLSQGKENTDNHAIAVNVLHSSHDGRTSKEKSDSYQPSSNSNNSTSSSSMPTLPPVRPRRVSYHAIDTIHHLESPRLDTSFVSSVNSTVYSSLSNDDTNNTTNNKDTLVPSTFHFTPNESFYAAKAAYIIWSSNIVGIICARSLHYQFLTWYWHSLPILLTSVYSFTNISSLSTSTIGLNIPLLVQFFYVLFLELGWNHHPPDSYSSFIITCLHGCLFTVLVLQATKSNWWYRIGSTLEKVQYVWYRKLTNNKEI